MTEDVAALTHAAVMHYDHTPLLVLADALDESHPRGMDYRARMLRKWVSNPERRIRTDLHFLGYDYAGEHVEVDPQKVRIRSQFVAHEDEGFLEHRLTLTSYPSYETKFIRTKVDPSEIAELAEHHPLPDSLTEFADKWSRLRFKPSYPEHYSRAVKS